MISASASAAASSAAASPSPRRSRSRSRSAAAGLEDQASADALMVRGMTWKGIWQLATEALEYAYSLTQKLHF